MTMLSFRLDEAEVRELTRCAEELGIDRSQLLREAVRQHLARLRSEHDATAWVEQPLDPGEMELREIADWGPAEDWTDWATGPSGP